MVNNRAARVIGLILGSGLGHLSAAVEGVAIPYADLDGLPHAGVSGHVPRLYIGDLEGRRVAVFGERSHYYDTGRADAMRPALAVVIALVPLARAAKREEDQPVWFRHTVALTPCSSDR